LDLKETHLLGDDIDKHWYYRSKLAAVRAYCHAIPKRRILDVGAGSGFFSRALLSDADVERALCVDTSYQEDSDLECCGKPLLFRRSAVAADADLILFIDVLEHVESDLDLLRSYSDNAPLGAHILIGVPALPFLWSDHDDFLGHWRRYTRRRIASVAEAAGLTVVGSSYYFGFVLPFAAATRVASRLVRRRDRSPRSQLRAHHPLVNATLTSICLAELPLVKINKLAGLTAFCLARKDSRA
jgi:hypothetical protein